ncbi:OmpP1/FadL family transporter [Sulfitobacter sp. MF3-043]|uniref:OmpP1/FadL family transporter n=1 Tax=Sulfitobacter sediminivivens TaxID=3252902 RepID=UPI0036D9A6FE
MKRFILATTALTASAFAAQAGGLDRSNQDIGIIFESGNRFELSFGRSSPTVDGNDGGTSTGNVTGDFNIISGALRYELNDQWSFAFIVDEPFGSDLTYPTVPGSTYGGTEGIVDSIAFTALARYKFDDAWSVHGGVRYQELEARVTLQGAGYGGLSGYNANFGSDGAFGYVIGGAFEKPEIALRVALTYQSAIKHDLPTTENFGGPSADTRVQTPESLNLEFQTGVAKDTLVFGSIRYARYSDTIVRPTVFAGFTPPGTSLTTIEDSTDYEIGVGRRFNDQWSGSVAIGYQRENGDSLVSPLGPTDGAKYISLGAKYQASDRLDISAGARYTNLGDAVATTTLGSVPFADNDAISIGIKIGYNF